jgi:hypothetical protein
MQPIETIAIERFLDLVKRASQSRSRDVRVEITDATILAAEIGLVLARMAALSDSALSAPQVTAMDGGTLR